MRVIAVIHFQKTCFKPEVTAFGVLRQSPCIEYVFCTEALVFEHIELCIILFSLEEGLFLLSVSECAAAVPERSCSILIAPLQQIQGVGAGKAKRYGKEFCELIQRHCEENDIERPEELRVRTVAKNSIQKVKIIQCIDRQIPLDDIATAEGLDFGELLTKVEEIVYSGTRLNIDYFIDEVMDEDHVDDIYDYFCDSVTDDLDTALDELGSDYSEDEVRLIRIKFLSEMAN